ncbi:MAG: helix-turn-helix domain-containing protein [Helicobacteraceae bacterium]|jgi:hypothetical protein|nr:helix-turn-helix domain-containing protein [Helicobacteraceae bacterium]
MNLNDAISRLDVSRSKKLILQALADFADEGVSNPTMATLAGKTNFSRRHIITLIFNLEAEGLIGVKHCRKGGNDYKIVLPPGISEVTAPPPLFPLALPLTLPIPYLAPLEYTPRTRFART